MPVPVRLNFVPPAEPDLARLEIYEASTKTGSFVKIEDISAIGTYPNYISSFTTDNATAADYWFAIDWFDAEGGHVGMSDPIQGGVLSILGEIVSRVMIRDATINENIVYDEARAVLYAFLPAGTDIEDAPISMVNPAELSGLALLTQARCYLFDVSEGEEEYTVGLVSQRLKNTRSLDFVKSLLKMAEAQLGLSYSAILQMAEVPVGAGSKVNGQVDISRLIVEVL